MILIQFHVSSQVCQRLISPPDPESRQHKRLRNGTGDCCDYWVWAAGEGLHSLIPLPFNGLHVQQCYANYARLRPDLCKVVAIAEPRPKARNAMAGTHSVDESLVFSTWKELYTASSETIKTIGKRLADAVVVGVQDAMHAEVVLAFAKQGYHILCEKPMATTIDDCIKMTAAVKKAGIIFGLGHG